MLTHGSPVCPWCREEVTDSPIEDCAGRVCVLECQGCGQLVKITTQARVVYDTEIVVRATQLDKNDRKGPL